MSQPDITYLTCDRTLGQMVDLLATQLSDNEAGINALTGKPHAHKRWDEAYIVQAINDFVRLLRLTRPDLFTDAVPCVDLMPGCSWQKLPTQCLKFYDMLAGGKCCGKPNRISMSSADAAEKLTSRRCAIKTVSVKGAENYCVTDYAFDPGNPKYFRVVPPVPPNTEVTITLSCVTAGPCYNWDEDEDEPFLEPPSGLDTYEVVLFEFVLYRAYMANTESITSQAKAKTHWEVMASMLNLGKLGDYAFHHPDLFVMGPIAEGTGNAILQSR